MTLYDVFFSFFSDDSKGLSGSKDTTDRYSDIVYYMVLIAFWPKRLFPKCLLALSTDIIIYGLSLMYIAGSSIF
jgi:hypothetical protein